MQREIDIYDVKLITNELCERFKQFADTNPSIEAIVAFPMETPLVDVVAAGRLFVMNGNGKLEKVISASYWIEGQILSVCDKGYEWNEDGETTREWHNRAKRD